MAHVIVPESVTLDLDHQIAYAAPERPVGAPLLGVARMSQEAVVARLSTRQCEILYWAGMGVPLHRIAGRLGAGCSPAEFRGAVAELERCGVGRVRWLMPSRAGGAHGGDGAYAAPMQAEPATLFALWRRSVAAHAARPFIASTEGGSLTYGDAAEIVSTLSARLAAAGVAKGERVCVHADPHPEAALLFWATVGLGAIFVPLDPAWPEPKIGRAIALCEPKLLFVDPSLGPDALRAAAGRAAGACVVLDALGGEVDPSGIIGGPAAAVSARPFSSWLADEVDGADAPPAADEAPPSLVNEEDSAVVLFTSGTTGEPKGVELSHGALVRTSRLLAETYGLAAADVLLSVGAYHTMSGLRNPLIVTVQAGAAVMIPSADERRSPLAAVDACRRHRATVLSVVPALLKQLYRARDRLDPGDLASVRFVLSTGAALSAETLRRLRSFLPAPVYDYYGLTETCGVCVLVDPADYERQRGTIGIPRGVIAQIVDADGAPVEPGQAGQLRIYGANNMRGYFRDPERTATILRGGWIYTGDLAVRRPEDRALVLVGRARDIVKDPGGSVLHLAEVERAIEGDPAIEEAAACGYRDENGEERYAAFVRLTSSSSAADDADGVVRRLRRRLLERLGARRMPTGIIPVEDLPRGANGKVLKSILVREHLAHDGL